MKKLLPLVYLLMCGTPWGQVTIVGEESVHEVDVTTTTTTVATTTTVTTTTTCSYQVWYTFTGNPTNASAPITNDGCFGTDGTNAAGAAAMTLMTNYVNCDGGDYGNTYYAPAYTTNSSFTLAAWVRQSIVTANDYVMGAENVADDGQVSMGLDFASKPRLLVDFGPVLKASGSNVALGSNTWTYLVGVYDGTADSLYFYVDGLIKDSDAYVATNGMTMLTYWVGGRHENWGLGGAFLGDIDDVIFDTTAWASNVVKAAYDAGRTGP